MLDLLLQYGLFLAKIVTVVIALLFIIITIANYTTFISSIISIDNVKVNVKNNKPLLKKHYEKYSRSHQKNVLLKNKYDETIL